MDFFLFLSQGKSEKSLTPPNKINPNRGLLFTVADILLLSHSRGRSRILRREVTVLWQQFRERKIHYQSHIYSMTFVKKIKHRKSIKDKTLLSEKGGRLPPKLPPWIHPVQETKGGNLAIELGPRNNNIVLHFCYNNNNNKE